MTVSGSAIVELLETLHDYFGAVSGYESKQNAEGISIITLLQESPQLATVPVVVASSLLCLDYKQIWRLASAMNYNVWKNGLRIVIVLSRRVTARDVKLFRQASFSIVLTIHVKIRELRFEVDSVFVCHRSLVGIDAQQMAIPVKEGPASSVQALQHVVPGHLFVHFLANLGFRAAIVARPGPKDTA
jgi:hypothetical protein